MPSLTTVQGMCSAPQTGSAAPLYHRAIMGCLPLSPRKAEMVVASHTVFKWQGTTGQRGKTSQMKRIGWVRQRRCIILISERSLQVWGLCWNHPGGTSWGRRTSPSRPSPSTCQARPAANSAADLEQELRAADVAACWKLAGGWVFELLEKSSCGESHWLTAGLQHTILWDDFSVLLWKFLMEENVSGSS